MIYIDKYNRSLYGKYEFEPVLEELIETDVFQRLKHVQQHGPDVWVWEHANITRYEHCLGVCLLLKKINAELEDQIAGLLHDLSHTAFSHAVDFVFNRELSADYADRALKKFMLNSKISAILKKYGYSVEKIADLTNFPLVKKNLPDLCADRIDYLCRDLYRYSLMRKSEVDFLIRSLTVVKGEVIFTNRKAAELCGYKFILASKKVFASAETIFYHTKVAEAIRIGLENGLLSEDDLFTTDEVVGNKLKKSSDPRIKIELSYISDSVRLLEVGPTEKYDYHLRVKIRIPDPKYLSGGKVLTLSNSSKSFKIDMDRSIADSARGHYVLVEKLDNVSG